MHRPLNSQMFDIGIVIGKITITEMTNFMPLKQKHSTRARQRKIIKKVEDEDTNHLICIEFFKGDVILSIKSSSYKVIDAVEEKSNFMCTNVQVQAVIQIASCSMLDDCIPRLLV